MGYWLMKSEPSTFGINDLASMPKKTEFWDGVRNYQARNFMRDDMKKKDLAFFYHSNCKVPGVIGIVEIVKEAYPDKTAFDPTSQYYDEKSTPEKPRWFGVEIKLIETFSDIIALPDLKANPKLKDFRLVKPGNRLSILPVEAMEWKTILSMRQTA